MLEYFGCVLELALSLSFYEKLPITNEESSCGGPFSFGKIWLCLSWMSICVNVFISGD